jgi:hypothetical protein
MANKVPVLFIAGTGRTGSTLIGNLLATTPGAIAVGELRHLWTRGVGENWRCGCGQSFEACPFWTSVIVEAFGDRERLDLVRLRSSERELLRLRAGVRALGWIRDPHRIRVEHEYYLTTTDRLYRAIAKISKADIIVDSSKTPTYGALLSVLDSVDLRVLHLIRDPRATAYSWITPKPSPDRGEGGTMDQIGAAKSAVLWTWWNGITDALWSRRPDVPVARVRYETLTNDPESSLRVLRDKLAPELAGRSLGVKGHVGELGIAHTVSGNPDRMRTGPVTIVPDERWRSGLTPGRQMLVLAIAGLAMLRYGYGRKRG